MGLYLKSLLYERFIFCFTTGGIYVIFVFSFFSKSQHGRGLDQNWHNDAGLRMNPAPSVFVKKKLSL